MSDRPEPTEPDKSPEPAAQPGHAGPRFGPTVLGGIVAAALVAYAGSRSWVDIPTAAEQLTAVTGAATLGEVPLAGALGLVMLAAWGALLVTRGRVRRGIALLGVVAALGAVAASVVGLGDVTDSAVKELATRGYDKAAVQLNLWGWISPVFALVSAALSWVAFRAAPRWPEMGRKYDAPVRGAGPVAGVEVADTSNVDLWKSMDEGHDPTL